MATLSKIITTVDSHTAGECTRLITGGLPPLRGKSMVEKLAYIEENFPKIPKYLLLEPRGHKDMFGAVLTEPCSSEADIGVIFMDNQGYEPMCGHAVIGTATTVLETGMFLLQEPQTLVTLDTPSGLVRAYAQVREGRVQSVAFENVPSFVYQNEIILDIPELGSLTIDVVFGGLFFVFVDAAQIDLDLVPSNAHSLADLGMRILAVANQTVQVQHPTLPHLNKIIDLRFYCQPGPNGTDSRNVVILGDHMVDRSPCGTGTSAETALRHAQARLRVGERFTTESIIGTRFTGEVVEETTVGPYPAVIPRVTGSAYLTGFHRFVLAPDDPFPAGFRLAE